MNPHERIAHKILSLARLPVPTLPHIAFMEKFLLAMNILLSGMKAPDADDRS